MLGDANPLRFQLALALGGDAAVLAIAPVAQVVELALQGAAPVVVALVVDAALELLLALGLSGVRNRDRRARVVAERAEASAGELELDEVLLQLHHGDGHRIARTDGGAVALQAVAVFLVVERVPGVAMNVDAVGGARHVDVQRHALAFERGPQRFFSLCGSRRGEGQQQDARMCTHWL